MGSIERFGFTMETHMPLGRCWVYHQGKGEGEGLRRQKRRHFSTAC